MKQLLFRPTVGLAIVMAIGATAPLVVDAQLPTIDAVVREIADTTVSARENRRALEGVGSAAEAFISVLIPILQSDTRAEARTGSAQALSWIARGGHLPAEHVPALINALVDPVSDVRAALVDALAGTVDARNDPHVRDIFIRLTQNDSDFWVALYAAAALNISNRGCEFAGSRSATWRDGGAFEFEFADRGGIRGDALGAYRAGTDGVESGLVNSGIRLYPFGPGGAARAGSRTISVNLGSPLADADDYGVQEVEAIVVHWKQDDEARLIAGPLDMPIGAIEKSERLEVFVNIEDRRYILRFGSLDVSRCWRAANVDGSGTTAATLHRLSADEWTVALPSGSFGRLSERFGDPGNENTGRFEDRGLYEVGGHFIIRHVEAIAQDPIRSWRGRSNGGAPNCRRAEDGELLMVSGVCRGDAV